MANLTNTINVHEDENGVKTSVSNYISQINVGQTVYDIATHHGIKFKEGDTEITWNGLTDLTVVIPTIADLVQNPIEFAGTVGANGEITWVDGHTKEIGSLVFITDDCKFEEKFCEAGDMAIYDGAKWNIVSGENQVTIVAAADQNDKNTHTVAIGSAKNVLTVEGKTLALALDYADLNTNHLVTPKGAPTEVVFDTMTVGSVHVKLTKDENATATIGEEKTLNRATALADGTVDLKHATGLVNSITWGTFDAGSETTFGMNTAQDLTVSGGDLKLTSNQTSGDFVESVELADVVKFKDVDTEATVDSITTLTTLTSAVGTTQFFKGIHSTGKDETGKDETADLTIKYVAPTKENVNFVEGLVGDLFPVTSITPGNFELEDGNALATGFGADSTSGEVVSNVSVSPSKTSVLNEAKVENHVLSFGSTNVTSDVTTTCSYKSLTKTGFKYTSPVATTTSFVKSGFATVEGDKYTFDKVNETVYSADTKNWKISTPELTVKYGSYTFDDSDIKAAVPKSTFVTSVTAGRLPSWTGYDYDTVDVTGTVGTALSVEEFKFNALKANDIKMPEYSLSIVESDGDITVGAAGDLAANTATVDLSDYITGVAIVESKS